MGSFASTLFKIILGWLQGAVSAVWNAFTTENGGFLTWIGRHWIPIAGILCLIGLAADLAVYIMRWKPFGKRNVPAEEETEQEEYGFSRNYRNQPSDRTPEENRIRSEFGPETESDSDPDLSQWSNEPEIRHHTPAETEKPAVVTNAGYVVPADSPYRRPAEYPPQRISAKVPVSETEDVPFGREESVPVSGKRRRRLSVSGLFSDPEEEMHEFDAPQHIIDSRKAYHNPVYPRGWKKSESNGK